MTYNVFSGTLNLTILGHTHTCLLTCRGPTHNTQSATYSAVTAAFIVFSLGRGVNDEVWKQMNAVREVVLIHRLAAYPVHRDGRYLGVQHHHQGPHRRHLQLSTVAASVITHQLCI